MQTFIVLFGALIVFILSTLSGGGASLLLMPLVATVVGVKSVAPVMTITIAMSSTSKTLFFFKDIDWQIFKWLLPSTIVGSVLGAKMFAILSTEYLQVFIGLLLVSTIFQLREHKSTPKFNIRAWHFAPISLVVSFLSGLIGGVGPLMNSCYFSYGSSKESLLGTRSANAILLHLTKILSYAYLGFVTNDVIKYGLMFGLVSMCAVFFGKLILNKISDAIFRKIVVATMVASGLIILWQNRMSILF